jgi:hypothetical protein
LVGSAFETTAKNAIFAYSKIAWKLMGSLSPMQKTLYSRQYQHMLKLLREKRVLAALSQTELAERLEWTQAEVSKCETGVRRLDVIELKLWLEALDSDMVTFVQELIA